MVFLDRSHSQHLLQTLEGGGDNGLHEGEGGNARHKEGLTMLMFHILQIREEKRENILYSGEYHIKKETGER